MDTHQSIENRKARHHYHILETLDVGLQLTGTEIKSVREGKVNIADAYLLIRSRELFLINAHISPYSHGNIQNHEPTRSRKCLAHAKEIAYLKTMLEKKGLTLIPLKLFFHKQWLKCQVAIAQGKKLHDKRATAKERAISRTVAQAQKRRRA